MEQFPFAVRLPPSPPHRRSLQVGDRPGEPHTSTSTKRRASESLESTSCSESGRELKRRCIRGDSNHESGYPSGSPSSSIETDLPTPPGNDLRLHWIHSDAPMPTLDTESVSGTSSAEPLSSMSETFAPPTSIFEDPESGSDDTVSECSSIFSQATNSTQSEASLLQPGPLTGWIDTLPLTDFYINFDIPTPEIDHFDFDTFLNLDSDNGWPSPDVVG
ncbi:hypothetical protein BJX76DRAFT_319683 [Aspergillus varians]